MSLLDSRPGRLIAFFFLYLTEGIPQGFIVVAVVTQMSRQKMGPAATGAFVGAVLFPWAMKWLMGPVVDVFYSNTLGRRRGWIVTCQILMIATLVVAMRIDYVKHLSLFTWVLIVHSIFAATQDVAIDALAVNTLKPDERGTANGLMFAGAYLGNGIGGAGAQFLVGPLQSFPLTFLVPILGVLAVTLTVSIWLREPAHVHEIPGFGETRLHVVGRELGHYLMTAYRAFFRSSTGFLGLMFALLPAGAYALNLALGTNLAVELGLNDDQVGILAAGMTILSAIGCVAGGFMSDRFGRRITIAFWVFTMSLPTLFLAFALWRHHWIMPIKPGAFHPTPARSLLVIFWTTSLVYSLFNGLMYGVRAAFFMDLVNPAVAATQFTAYMAVLNFVVSYSARWQGMMSEKVGYPITLVIDAIFGCACLALLPLLRKKDHPIEQRKPLAMT